MKQCILFVSTEHVQEDRLPKIDDHYEWFQVNKALTYQRLSSVWQAKSPCAVYSYGGSESHNALAYLYRVRRCWIHLDHLPAHLDVVRNVFYHFLDTSRHVGSPTLSVITSTFKSGRKIYRPLQSLLNQTYPNWEWIIWDDSPDDDVYKKLIEMSRMDMRIQVYKAPRPSGVIGLMKRRSAALATGEYIVEVDHDDDLHPDLFQWIVDAGNKHKDAEFFYTDSAELYEDTFNPVTYGDYFGLGYSGHRFEWSDRYKCYLASAHAPGPNPDTITHIVGVPNHVRVWRAAFYDKIGKHNPYLSVGDDYELIVRTYISGAKWCHIRACAYYQYRNADGNFTFIRNSLIQHNVHHTFTHYRARMPGSEMVNWRYPAWALDADKQPHPKTHYEFDPFAYDTTYAMVAPTRDLIAQYADAPDSMIAIVGKPPDDIPVEWKRKIVWYDMTMYSDDKRKLNYAYHILHRGRRFVAVEPGAPPDDVERAAEQLQRGVAEVDVRSEDQVRSLILVATFLYNGDEIVSQQLRMLYPHVDRIYVVEGRETFRGHAKDKLYRESCSSVFQPYADKITFVDVDFTDIAKIKPEFVKSRSKADFMNANVDAWIREYDQRNAVAARILSDYGHSDLSKILCICTDADEIPDMTKVVGAKEWIHEICTRHDVKVMLEMHMLYYNWNWAKGFKWYKAFICTAEMLSRRRIDDMRSLTTSQFFLPLSGWHCSYFMSVNSIVRKIQSFSHAEYDCNEYKDEHHIRKCIDTGVDLFDRGSEEQCLPFDDRLRPAFIAAT